MNHARGHLKELRKAAGVTQEQLAREVDVTTSTIQKIESGRSIPRADLAMRIARFLDTTVETLFGEDAA